MQTLLISVEGGEALAAHARFGVSGGTIGRADNNDLVLSDPERSVSRLHARVEWREGRFLLVNMGINPVVWNDQMVATADEARLAAGDVLRIGRFTLRVDAGPSGPTPEPAPADAPDEEEALFDDMTGLPLPRRARDPVVAGGSATPDIAFVDEGESEDLSEQGHVPAAAVPAMPVGAQELWLAELLKGMGCAAPQWSAPLTAQQIALVGALMRSAMNDTMRTWMGHYAPGAQREWFSAFEASFVKACEAGLPLVGGPGTRQR